MKDRRQSRGVIVDGFLKTLSGPSASPEQLRESAKRLRSLVEVEWKGHREGQAPPPIVSRRKAWLAIPALAAAIVAALVFVRIQPTQPLTAPPDSIHLGEPFRTGEQTGRTIALADGSQVEMGAETELRVDRSAEGIRITLTRGAVIVTAARQRTGRLEVQTKDCTVSVVGTIFSVRAEASGSRVSVFEGKVNVAEAGETHLLVPGQQFVTTPAISPVPLEKEIEWSRNAVALAALVAPPQPSAAAAPARQQTPGSGPSSIEGRVMIRGTNAPLSDVELELSRVEGAPAAPLSPAAADAFATLLNHNTPGFPTTNGNAPIPAIASEVKYSKTGEDGRFKFDDLKEGKYRLAAVRNGGEYYPAEFGQRDLQQRGLYFPVGAGEALKDLRIEMTPTGAITGRVTDEDGQPMGHVIVLALTAQFQSGEHRSYIERQAVTDENGNYRLYWLGPGRYYVAAVYEDPKRRSTDMAPTAPPGRTIVRSRATSPTVVRQVLADGSVIEEAYGVVYFGGTTDPVAATAVEVRPGTTYAGADIPMGAGKMRTHHITGIVINGETGQPARGAQVLAIPRQWRPNALVLRGTTNADGAFDLAGAFPDGYFLTATIGSGAPVYATGQVGFAPSPGSPAKPQVGYLSLDTDDRQPNNVRIVMSPGIMVPVQVGIEGTSPENAAAALAKMRINLTRDPELIAMPDVSMPPPPALAPPTGQPGIRPGGGRVGGNEDFTMFIAPGDFRVNITNIPSNTYVKSIRMGGNDILRAGLHVTQDAANPLQVVIGTDGGTITGAVVDATSRPFTNATIALVPDSPDLRGHPEFYRNTASDAAGSFTLKAIPPGSYKLFAWEWAPPDSWQNADFIRAYEGLGKSLRVAPFEKQERIQLTVIAKGR